MKSKYRNFKQFFDPFLSFICFHIINHHVYRFTKNDKIFLFVWLLIVIFVFFNIFRKLNYRLISKFIPEILIVTTLVSIILLSSNPSDLTFFIERIYYYSNNLTFPGEFFVKYSDMPTFYSNFLSPVYRFLSLINLSNEFIYLFFKIFVSLNISIMLIFILKKLFQKLFIRLGVLLIFNTFPMYNLIFGSIEFVTSTLLFFVSYFVYIYNKNFSAKYFQFYFMSFFLVGFHFSIIFSFFIFIIIEDSNFFRIKNKLIYFIYLTIFIGFFPLVKLIYETNSTYYQSELINSISFSTILEKTLINLLSNPFITGFYQKVYLFPTVLILLNFLRKKIERSKLIMLLILYFFVISPILIYVEGPVGFIVNLYSTFYLSQSERVYPIFWFIILLHLSRVSGIKKNASNH